MADDKKIGATLVIGGGIGGIQAALDLANTGFKVYLLEKSPSIGGVMAQLDKTFPTNDCSMCILAPKLVDCGRHPNIELITYAELEKIDGEAGNFHVKVRRKPTFVDWDKCNGCGECSEVCPVKLKNEFEEGLTNRTAIYKLFPQAAPNKFTIDRRGVSPCKVACPAGVNAQGYVALVAQGKFKEALALEREDNPLPSICGRVCTRPCETECKRGEFDEPIAIRDIKRFIADYEEDLQEPELPEQKEGKVAIIGSGPSGLSCAYQLAKLGYPTTIFEALPMAGGMLIVGIPEFRLPREKITRDIDYIKSWGVDIKTNSPVKDPEQLIKDGYSAVYIATGAHSERKLGIEGEGLKGINYGIDFLRKVNLGEKVEAGKKVAVIGGGNSAIDAARTELRLGAGEVTIVYRRSRVEMPADEEEIIEAEKEGIKIEYLATPTKFISANGKLKQMECIRMELGPPDESGRRRPIPIKGSEFIKNVDTVIPTIGQTPDTSYLPEGTNLKITEKWNSFIVDEDTLETSVPGIFAGGDAVTGPATVIEAIATGKEAAISIDRFIRKIDLKEGRKKDVKKVEDIEIPKDIKHKARVKMATISIGERVKNFNEVNLGMTEEQVKLEAERCLACGGCSECGECKKVCEANAIDFNQEEKIIDINIGSVILSCGTELYDGKTKREYGDGRFDNVITSIEFERILSASGPFQGHIKRPGDRKEPRSIAFIQCVGSRDDEHRYCSSVCCMHATKEAIIAMEHSPGIGCTVFYMDMRAFGKGFDEYYEKAKKDGVRYIRCRPSSIEELPESKNLLIKYSNGNGKVQVEGFDMVVLSCGLQPTKQLSELSRRLDIKLNEFGFLKTDTFTPINSNKEGVFVCGPCTEPKDIPETVTQASAAAAKSMELLSEKRNSLIEIREYPPEIDVKDQEPRIGVFICNCGINIGGYVDVQQVVLYTRTLPNVIYTEENLYTCSEDSQLRIIEMIKEHKLNRVVVASCTPRTHEALFRDTIREAGLNPYLFEMANIRDQCSWIHMNEPKGATEKAKDLVEMAVAKAALLTPLKRVEIDVIQKALVIGGGIAGMISSLSLARQGFEVYLVEKEKKLGGNLKHIFYTIEGNDVQDYLMSLVKEVKNNKLIHLFTNAKIESTKGFIGNYKTEILPGRGKRKKFEHGVVIVATGAGEYKSDEYLYGQDERVVTQRELEEKIVESNPLTSNLKYVVMIQCVGSRDNNGNPYCSRVCCTHAIKNSLKLLELNPKTKIYILYREVRTYGFKENFYTKARESGVMFIRYDNDRKPIVENSDGSLSVSLFEPVLQKDIEIHPDLVVLSTGIEPNNNDEIAKMLKVPLNSDGYFLEAHVKLRPVDFATEGVFVAGLAHSPKFINETICQAGAAAARASTILASDKYYTEATVSHVDEDICVGCGICSGLCPYEAIEIVSEDGKRKSKVNEALCKGCGTCVAACPSGAMDQYGFTKNQIMSMIEAIKS